MLMENDLLLRLHCHYFPRQPPNPACTIQFARVEVERQVEVEEELYCQLDQGGHQSGENAQLVNADMKVLIVAIVWTAHIKSFVMDTSAIHILLL